MADDGKKEKGRVKVSNLKLNLGCGSALRRRREFSLGGSVEVSFGSVLELVLSFRIEL